MDKPIHVGLFSLGLTEMEKNKYLYYINLGSRYCQMFAGFVAFVLTPLLECPRIACRMQCLHSASNPRTSEERNPEKANNAQTRFPNT